MREQDSHLIKVLETLYEAATSKDSNHWIYENDLQEFVSKHKDEIIERLISYSRRIDKRIVVGVSTILVRKGKILLGLRKGGLGSGTWGFPGGKVEKREYLFTAGQRETVEEVGIYLSTGQFEYKTHTEDIYGDNHFITHYLMAKIGDDVEAVLKEPEKCEEWRWFEPKAIYKIDNLFEPVYNLIQKVDLCSYIN